LHNAYANLHYFATLRIIGSVPDENITNESESLCIGESNLKESDSEVVNYNLAEMICSSESNDEIADKCEQHICKGI
jgi:hypothetical protein